MTTLAVIERQLAELREMVTALLAATPRKDMRDPSIAGFCRRNGISRSTYLNLRRAGKGPAETAIGTRRIITEEAEARWQQERQAEAMAIEAARAAARAGR